MTNELPEVTLHKIAAGTYTPEELSAFLKALEELDEAAYIQVYNKLYEIVARQQPGTIDETFRASLEEKLNTLSSSPAPVLRLHGRYRWIRWTAAAAIVVLITGVAYWFSTRHEKRQPPVVKRTNPINISPGGNHATLTLSNGSIIVLDEAKNGDLAQQVGSRIVKADSGRIVYYPSAARSELIEYNTISTPRAGQYHIILPDGTNVWLNAASSLRFPTLFSAQTREVQLSGEGYFEVSSLPAPSNSPGGGGKKIPFIVDIIPPHPGGQGGAVEVLGTHFNINAYEDENIIKTTLLEGSVKVVSRSRLSREQIGNEQQTAILHPGEQAVTTNHKLQTTNKIDLQQVLAWKNGFFEFNNMSLPAIMRQISRWYDVDVSLEASYPEKRFGGRISRKLNLSNIIKMLETYGVHFKMENRKLIVVQ
jgi:ferric-dicitrate binding protein FerR (iron transport regulator)